MNAVLIVGMPTNLIVELNSFIETMMGYRSCRAPVAFSCPGVNLKDRSQLNAFFSTEEKKAFRVVRYSIGNDEDALDIIQD
ncbi:MAG: hypothetical protein QNJ69_08990, partial [Gammaproteobacteria bacterium]|nr:hypothetical protein [Gammaproteobacteria bacterium]